MSFPIKFNLIKYIKNNAYENIIQSSNKNNYKNIRKVDNKDARQISLFNRLWTSL